MMPDYPKPPFASPRQPMPGSTEAMQPRPDHGEKSYKGCGRLKGKPSSPAATAASIPDGPSSLNKIAGCSTINGNERQPGWDTRWRQVTSISGLRWAAHIPI